MEERPTEGQDSTFGGKKNWSPPFSICKTTPRLRLEGAAGVHAGLFGGIYLRKQARPVMRIRNRLSGLNQTRIDAVSYSFFLIPFLSKSPFVRLKCIISVQAVALSPLLFPNK